MSLAAWLKRPGPNGFGYGSTAEDVTQGLDLRGRSYLVTGCSSGIGLETLQILALRGARVLAAARTLEKARGALRAAGAEGVALACDLSEPNAVRACAKLVAGTGPPLDGIVANAGVMAPRTLQRKHGYEIQFLANHVGHSILVTDLLGTLAADARVVVVSSHAHFRAPPEGIQFGNLDGEREYRPWRAYAQSKLANILFTSELAERLPRPGQTANSLHPGVIRTGLQRHMGMGFWVVQAVAGPLYLKSIPQGAATQCLAAAHPWAATLSGRYLADCNVAEPSSLASDHALAKRLWEETERIVASF